MCVCVCVCSCHRSAHVFRVHIFCFYGNQKGTTDLAGSLASRHGIVPTCAGSPTHLASRASPIFGAMPAPQVAYCLRCFPATPQRKACGLPWKAGYKEFSKLGSQTSGCLAMYCCKMKHPSRSDSSTLNSAFRDVPTFL